LPHDFPFGEVLEDATVLNEVGGRDYLPALAEKVTWGYGSTGTYGFHVPGVRDRYHNKAAHSTFLKVEFCKKYWVSFLRDGKIVPGDEQPESQRLWTSCLLKLANKYVLMVLIGSLAIWTLGIRSQPITVEIMSNGSYAYVGSPIQELVHSIQNDDGCIESSAIDLIRQRRCVSLDRIDGAVMDLVACTLPGRSVVLESRDPLTILERLSRGIQCLRVEGVERRRVSLGLDAEKTLEWRDNKGATYQLCGCSMAAIEAFKKEHESAR
jgi:hypothetical protein